MLMLLVFVALSPATRLFAAAAMSGVIDPYLRVQVKLAADTVDGLAGDATAIVAAAAQFGKDGAALTAAAKHLQAATTIDAAREAFWNVTTALFAYADTTKTDLGPDVRRTFCPMENKSWAQKDGEILNPYAGKKMLHCGVFTDKK